MSEPMSATVFSENIVKVAEEHYRRGNLKDAVEILRELTFVFPNTSTNHRKISQVHVAHQAHWRSVNTGFTLYDILGIDQFWDYQTARRQYMNIVAQLCPEKNKSAAAKLALKIINATWRGLCDPRRSRASIEQELRIMRREGELYDHQSVREGKRPCVDIIDTDSDSDSDSD